MQNDKHAAIRLAQMKIHNAPVWRINKPDSLRAVINQWCPVRFLHIQFL